jgi:hypothetical protein
MVTVFQSVWAIVIAAWGCFLAWLGNPLGYVFLVACALYVPAIRDLRRGKPWAWWASLAMPVFIVVNTAPNIVYNFILFLRDDPLFQDSPGTIYIVGISALLFLVPAVTLFVMLLAKRRTLLTR